MNEELKNQALQVLSGIITDAVKVKEFAIEQAPDVVNQLLAWKFYESLLEFSILPFFLVIAGFIFLCSYKKQIGNQIRNESLETVEICSGTVFAILLILSPICINFLDWLQIWIAPKVYLIEYAAKLVR